MEKPKHLLDTVDWLSEYPPILFTASGASLILYSARGLTDALLVSYVLMVLSGLIAILIGEN